jgi:hypothetical protein
MAHQVILPKRLSKCNIPIWPACIYGKATKQAWRDKPSNQATTPIKPTTPGAVVLVDMLTYPTPGLIAQMTGTPTFRRYLHAAVYVDQATGYGFMWLQKYLSEEEPLGVKLAFERQCRSFNVNISHYHADNGVLLPMVGNRHATANDKQSLILASTAIIRTVWQNVVFKSSKTWQELCLFMLNNNGPKPSQLTSGPLPSVWQTMPLMKHPICSVTRRYYLNYCSPTQRSVITLNTGTISVA